MNTNQVIKASVFGFGLMFLVFGFFGDMRDITESQVRFFLISSAFYLAIGRWWRD
jgi:hypothetical protein